MAEELQDKGITKPVRDERLVKEWTETLTSEGVSVDTAGLIAALGDTR